MPFTFRPETIGNDNQAAPSAVGQVSSPLPIGRFADVAKGSYVQIVLFTVFGILLSLTAALFIYKYYLVSQIDVKKARLAVYEKNLAGFPLEDMRRLSNRMKVINPLIKQHPSANAAFRIIEDSIENPVTFTRFELKANEVTRSFDLTLAAEAPNYRSVVQQMDTFKRKPYTTYLSNVMIDGLHPDDLGKVIFNVKSSIAIAGLRPEDLVLQTTAGAAQTQPQSVATTTAAVATTTPQAAVAKSAPLPAARASTTPR